MAFPLINSTFEKNEFLMHIMQNVRVSLQIKLQAYLYLATGGSVLFAKTSDLSRKRGTGNI